MSPGLCAGSWTLKRCSDAAPSLCPLRSLSCWIQVYFQPVATSRPGLLSRGEEMSAGKAWMGLRLTLFRLLYDFVMPLFILLIYNYYFLFLHHIMKSGWLRAHMGLCTYLFWSDLLLQKKSILQKKMLSILPKYSR